MIRVENKAVRSTVYRYLNICADEYYKGQLDATAMLRHIHALDALEQKSPVQFELSDGSHWLLVSLFNCDSQGNYVSDGSLPEQVNLVEVIAKIEDEKATEFAHKIAERLGWRVIDVTNR